MTSSNYHSNIARRVMDANYYVAAQMPLRYLPLAAQQSFRAVYGLPLPPGASPSDGPGANRYVTGATAFATKGQTVRYDSTIRLPAVYEPSSAGAEFVHIDLHVSAKHDGETATHATPQSAAAMQAWISSGGTANGGVPPFLQEVPVRTVRTVDPEDGHARAAPGTSFEFNRSSRLVPGSDGDLVIALPRNWSGAAGSKPLFVVDLLLGQSGFNVKWTRIDRDALASSFTGQRSGAALIGYRPPPPAASAGGAGAGTGAGSSSSSSSSLSASAAVAGSSSSSSAAAASGSASGALPVARGRPQRPAATSNAAFVGGTSSGAAAPSDGGKGGTKRKREGSSSPQGSSSISSATRSNSGRR